MFIFRQRLRTGKCAAAGHRGHVVNEMGSQNIMRTSIVKITKERQLVDSSRSQCCILGAGKRFRVYGA